MDIRKRDFMDAMWIELGLDCHEIKECEISGTYRTHGAYGKYRHKCNPKF
jgi:hypothetical protein